MFDDRVATLEKSPELSVGERASVGPWARKARHQEWSLLLTNSETVFNQVHAQDPHFDVSFRRQSNLIFIGLAVSILAPAFALALESVS